MPCYFFKIWSFLPMNTATRVQNLDEAVCISHRGNNLGKGWTIISTGIGKD